MLETLFLAEQGLCDLLLHGAVVAAAQRRCRLAALQGAQPLVVPSHLLFERGELFLQGACLFLHA
ncbi:hypothetical protein D9M68_981010 [compost metagenome]